MEILSFEDDPRLGIAGLTFLEGVDFDRIAPKRGISCIDLWPDTASFHMNKDHKSSKKIGDVFPCLDSMIVISEKLKDALSGAENVEFLPVSIYDHSDKKVDANFFILNPFTVLDAIDKEESEFEWNAIDPTSMSYIEELVLNDEVLENAPALFRLKHKTQHIFIRADFAEENSIDEFFGVDLVELDEFEG